MKNKKINKTYPAVFYKEEKSNSWILNFPDIPEAYTDAKTLDELWDNAREVLELSLEGKIIDTEVIPEPSDIENVIEKNLDKKVILVNVLVNNQLLYEKTSITIPKYLKDFAVDKEFNLSGMLSDLLLTKYKKHHF